MYVESCLGFYPSLIDRHIIHCLTLEKEGRKPTSSTVLYSCNDSLDQLNLVSPLPFSSENTPIVVFLHEGPVTGNLVPLT